MFEIELDWANTKKGGGAVAKGREFIDIDSYFDRYKSVFSAIKTPLFSLLLVNKNPEATKRQNLDLLHKKRSRFWKGRKSKNQIHNLWSSGFPVDKILPQNPLTAKFFSCKLFELSHVMQMAQHTHMLS